MSRRTDRTPVHGCTGRTAAGLDADESRHEQPGQTKNIRSQRFQTNGVREGTNERMTDAPNDTLRNCARRVSDEWHSIYKEWKSTGRDSASALARDRCY